MRWLVVGCGYTGERLARALLARGDEVWLTRRSAEAATALATALGPRAHGLALTLPEVAPLAAVPAAAIVVALAPPVDDAGTAERALVAARPDASRVVYVSSTGVYGAGHGAWVDEDAPVAPLSATGASRVAAEDAVRAGVVPWTILRAAGLYGPERGVAARLRAGTYRIIGDGSEYVSRVHVEDLVTAIIAAGTHPAAAARIYNVADDDPTPAGNFADQVATRLGVPLPPRIPRDGVSADLAAMFTADRRIANGRLKQELGVVLRHPRASIE